MQKAADDKKKLCFVIGPIGKDGSLERKHSDLFLNAVIKHVLQQAEFAYVVKRADEDADPGMINDRMVSDIINADLVVADLTDLNPNAFYELGIRHATEKPTIHLARTGTLLPFDNVAHRTIFVDLTDWHSIEQTRERLAKSARAITEPDYKVSNPITQANASFKMRQSGDPRDRVIAELQDRMSSLESLSNFSSDDTTFIPDIKRDEMFVLGHLNEALMTGKTQRAINTYSSATGVNKQLAERFIRLLMEGSKLEAIKLHRIASHTSLKEAAAFVDLIIPNNRTDSASRRPAE